MAMDLSLIPMTWRGVKQLTWAAQTLTLPTNALEGVYSYLRRTDIEHTMHTLRLMLEGLPSRVDLIPALHHAKTGLQQSLDDLDGQAARLYGLLSDRCRSLWLFRSLRYDTHVEKQLDVVKAAFSRTEHRSQILLQLLAIPMESWKSGLVATPGDDAYDSNVTSL